MLHQPARAGPAARAAERRAGDGGGHDRRRRDPQATGAPSEEPVGAFWPCPVCGARNPIVLEACEICGTPFAAVMRGDTRLAADPKKAFARSLMYPGLGHAMLGYSIDGFARGAVFALGVFIAIFLPLSVPITGLVVLAVVLAVATAVGVYVLSAVEIEAARPASWVAARRRRCCCGAGSG